MVGRDDTQFNVLGLEVEEARRQLEAAGMTVVEVRETASLKTPRPTGPSRVVRVRQTEHGIELTVAASLPPPREGHDHD